MERQQGSYALLQFSPRPERLEFVNVGVLLVVPQLKYVGIKFSKSVRRVERLFGKQVQYSIDVAKEAFENRLKKEIESSYDYRKIEYFAKRRANQMRLSQLMPIAVEKPDIDLEQLFEELVGDDRERRRQPKVSVKLKEAFQRAGVVHYLRPPGPIVLDEYGVTINAQFSYQNGVYNLIDAMRLSGGASNALKEAGKRAIEGQWLRKHSAKEGGKLKQLVVVGDFISQQDTFYSAVRDVMQQHRVKLYRLDDMRPLLEDIERSASCH